MSILTAENLVQALASGKTLQFSDELYLRELLQGEKRILYMQLKGEKFWRPFQVETRYLTEELWHIVSD